jgi:methyl-accepting chemotaxis protein
MSDDQLIAQRMNFMKLDEGGKNAIISVKAVIDRVLPDILDTFYRHIGGVPEVNHFFAEGARADAAKSAQLRHWKRISAADFSVDYLRSVRTIGQTHARIGLEPRWYIGGYALIADGLIAAVLTENWPKAEAKKSRFGGGGAVDLGRPDAVATALGALVKAILLDMDVAISTYIEAAEEGRRRAEEASAAAAKQQAVVVEAITKGLEHLAKGDLGYRSTEQFAPDYQKVQDDFNQAMSQLEQTIQAIASAAREVAAASGEISSGTTDLSERTERQAASLEQTSASMEQMSSIVKKNAENAREADKFTSGMREVAARGGAVVDQAVDAMARIQESSGKVVDIIGVIDEIARQTNLLALNAAVEAARAGEAGRGFAVVASEVRSLAQRSSQAAKDIKDLITNSTQQVRDGVGLVNNTGASFKEIAQSITKVAEIVSEISVASGEQSGGIEQINIALTQMDEATQQNSALVEQNAAAAKALEQQSQAMDQQVRFFQLGASSAAGGAGAGSYSAGALPSHGAASGRNGAGAKRPPVATGPRRPARRVQGGSAIALKEDVEFKEF